jgi:citrate synthase
MPEEIDVQALNSYLVSVSDHGLNASTFAARVVASTQAGMTSSILAAIGALKGPLHGGAPAPVLDMLDAIGNAKNAEVWLDRTVSKGERIMGFGHRIYRIRDPRADVIKAALHRIIESKNANKDRLHLAEAVETAAIAVLNKHKPERMLSTNVEYYTALLLEQLDIPRAAFTSVFAMGRTLGWVAHCREQIKENKLIRPQSIYVGPKIDTVT